MPSVRKSMAPTDPTKRLFYQQMSILYHWSVRQLRDQEVDYGFFEFQD